MTAAVILAGGRAQRLGGGDKGLHLLAGRPMLSHVIDRLKPQVRHLAINANGDPDRFARFGLPVVADAPDLQAGPLAGLLTAMRWSLTVVPEFATVVTVSTDVPFLPANLVTELDAAADGDARKIVLAASAQRVHHVIGRWPVALAGDLEAALERGERKVLDWIGRHASIVASFPLIPCGDALIDPFFNANTPEDLAEAHRTLMLIGRDLSG